MHKSIYFISLLMFLFMSCKKENMDPPVAMFDLEDTVSIAGSPIRFMDKSLNAPIKWYWNLGDGTVKTDRNPEHNYDSAGKYTVSLSTTNVNGTDLTSSSIIVIDTGHVSDIEGKVYKTVKLGKDWWMAENLATTTLNDGTKLIDGVEFSSRFVPDSAIYVWYNYDEPTYRPRYGALYNGFAVETRKLCPSGWHVPTDNEWLELILFAGGFDIAGNKLKESGTFHWESTTPEVKNQTGFTALPAGSFYHDGHFENEAVITRYWSSTRSSDHGLYTYSLSIHSDVSRYNVSFSNGYSVRCIKNK